MYVWKIHKFREAELNDLIFEYEMRIFEEKKWKKVKFQRLRERVVYFLYIDNHLTGPYKTPDNGENPERFFEIYCHLLRKEVLMLEPRTVAPSVCKKKVWFRTASMEDIERNTIFFELHNDNLVGPWTIPYDLTPYDEQIIKKIKQEKIFVVYERQQF